MSAWVTDQNIQDFKRKIAEEKDPEKRRILEQLLVQEQQKLARGQGTRD